MIKGWEIILVSDFIDIQNGFAFKSENFIKNGIPLVKIASIQSKKVVVDEKETYPKIVIDEKFKVHYNDLVIAMSGATTGKIGLYKYKNYAYLNQRVCKISSRNQKKLINKYLFYLFSSHSFANQMNECLTAGAQPNLSPSQIGAMKFFIPTNIDEQQRMVYYLENIDYLVESLKQMIKKKKLIKQGVMQELLTGKKRLPGYNGKLIKKELQELGDFTSGGVDKKSIPGQKSVKLLNFLDVYHRDFIFKNELYHIVTASDAQIKKCTLKKGDLFFTPSSELQTDLALSAVVMEDCPGCVYSYHITRFRFKDNFDIKFKSYMFNNKEFLDQASLIAEGSGKRYVVNLSKFKTLTITYPTDIKEQSAIAEILWDLDQEINSLEKDLGKYKNIKQGMMEQLLTGKIRVV